MQKSVEKAFKAPFGSTLKKSISKMPFN
jgi:hypothetical protein